MERFINEHRGATGARLCSWCHGAVPAGLRTRCGSLLCKEMIWRAQAWARCMNFTMRRDKHTCVVCGAGAAEVDHIIPVSLGGTGDLNNLRALCHECHKQATARLRRDGKDYLA